MNIHLKQNGNIVILYLEGKIDIDGANLIETTGRLSQEGNLKILCNLKDINIIDNNGLSVLAITYKNVVNKGGIMKFCEAPAHVRELFKTVRLDLVFDLYETEDKAKRAFEVVSEIDKLYLRRRFKRLEFYHPVKFMLLKGKDQKKYTGKMLNISGEGAFIYTKSIFPVSTQMILEISLDDNKIYCLEGSAIWHADKEIQPHCYPGMGIQFVNLPCDIQKDILDFIDRNMTFRSDT